MTVYSIGSELETLHPGDFKSMQVRVSRPAQQRSTGSSGKTGDQTQDLWAKYYFTLSPCVVSTKDLI
jgi:hypothetical protein